MILHHCHYCCYCFHGYDYCYNSYSLLPLIEKIPWTLLMETENLVLSLLLPSPTLLWLFSMETEGDHQRRHTHTHTHRQNGRMHLPKIYNFTPGANMWLYFPPPCWTCAVTAKIDLLFVGNYTQFPLVSAGENFSPNPCSKILASVSCFISVEFFPPQIFIEHLLCARQGASHEEEYWTKACLTGPLWSL